MAGKGTQTKRKNAAARGKSPKKRTTQGTASAKRSTTANKGRRNATKNSTRKTVHTRTVEEMNAYQDHLAFEQGIILLMLCLCMLLCYISLFGLAGKIGICIAGIMVGLFGWTAWLFPIGILCSYIFVIMNPGDSRVPRRIGSGAGCLCISMALTDAFTHHKVLSEYYQEALQVGQKGIEAVLFAFSQTSRGAFHGGMVGRGIARCMTALLGDVGGVLILFALLLVSIYIFYGVEWMSMLRRRNAYYREMGEAYEVLREQEEYEKPSYQVRPPKTVRRKIHSSRKMQTVNLQAMTQQMDQAARKVAEEKKVEKEKQAATAKSTDAMVSTDTMEEIIPQKENPRKSMSSILSQRKLEKDIQRGESVAVVEPTFGSVKTQIPIYREELKHKFGNKAGAPVEETDFAITTQTQFEGKELEEDAPEPEYLWQENRDEKGQENQPLSETNQPLSETITTSLSAETDMEVPEEEVKKLAQEWEEAYDAEKSKKPLASFVHKEEVTDVTPSCQKKSSSVRKQSISGKTEKTTQQTVKKKQESLAKPQQVQTKSEESKPYVFPSIEFMKVPEVIPGRLSDQQLRETALHLQETLKSFHVNVSMGAVTCGPTVTRYEVLPEQGVRVNKITNLADDLKLSLAAASIRIEAPIPGKAAVGIEVPNPKSSPVYFRELLEGDAFRESSSPVTFAVGKDIAGKKIMADISKMPHLLIAGATGSGKSVCINTLIMSILYKANPSDVKLIMIDPKVVELSVYNGIPHLFCPVVTDPKEAAASLNWAVREMMERYKKFEELGVRGIAGYNEKIQKIENAAEAGYEKMPLLVIIVDEFADLMMVASKEVEDAVCRLAQLARAAGIHLVLATQRPSVNVITGLIKANIPSRIAFSVSSAIDSRTILDRGGAEKLLGKGDMLFFASGQSDPIRVQGAFISDKEVGEVVEFLRNSNEAPQYNQKVTEIQEPVEESKSEAVMTKSENDEYFEDAGRFVIESERAAAGQLQRRFSIGFNRAGRIIDQLHKAGVVGAAEGTKPRKVLMSMEQFDAYLAGDTSFEEQAASGEEGELDSMVLSEDLLETVPRELIGQEEVPEETIDSLE